MGATVRQELAAVFGGTTGAVRKAILHLKRVDAVLRRVIEQVGPYRLARRTGGTHFEAVARSIIYQQLSGKAAGTIHARFEALFAPAAPGPARLLALDEAELRAVGLSRQKSGYLRDLAEKVRSGEVAIESLEQLDDDQVIDALSRVKGVGRWTAQMFLLFRLGRLDVLPTADLGIQKAIQRAYRLRKLPGPERVRAIGAPWSPYASVASWYLWRSLDGAQ
jgi:DNA-3-methyladenine glycosylase II